MRLIKINSNPIDHIIRSIINIDNVDNYQDKFMFLYFTGDKMTLLSYVSFRVITVFGLLRNNQKGQIDVYRTEVFNSIKKKVF